MLKLTKATVTRN